ncbi:MAG: glutamate-cysteine ligase family protein, partial [Rubrobacteraceae bacterium]
AMDSAGVGSDSLHEMSGGILDMCWLPVRLSPHGTAELRGLDSNHPDTILAVSALVRAAADRLKNENLSVEPVEGLRRFESDGKRLCIPDFEGVGSELFFAAATEGPNDPMVAAYLDSIIEFAAPDKTDSGSAKYVKHLKNEDGSYRTTEAEILHSHPPSEGSLAVGEEELRLVREACDKLEKRVAAKDPVPNPG